MEFIIIKTMPYNKGSKAISKQVALLIFVTLVLLFYLFISGLSLSPTR